MSKPTARSFIRLQGVRHNNLKNFDLDLPLHRLIVITGVSGSGKSSLAFDTLFAEGQRRYTETFSPYARQFLDRMDKPQVDRIDGIPPAIAIEQRNSVRSTRSTVGTMTEICDYLKLLWPHLAELHCRQCRRPVRKDSPQQIWRTLHESTPGSESLISFDLPLSDKLSLDESLALVSRQGYQRLLFPDRKAEDHHQPTSTVELRDAPAPAVASGVTTLSGSAILRIDEAAAHLKSSRPGTLTVVQDRLRLDSTNRARFVEACEQAYHFGKGRLAVHPLGAVAPTAVARFSNRLHCAACDLEYRDPSPALFSFNHPVGACPECRGFGRVITIDYNLAIPDRTKTLAGGAVRPWQTGVSADCQRDLLKFCRVREVPINVPFEDLPRHWQAWVIDGDPGYGSGPDHEWPRAWYGVKGYFRWLESKAYKMHVRVLLSRYRSYAECPSCHGSRFQPESLLYRVRLPKSPDLRHSRPLLHRTEALNDPAPSDFTLADFYRLPIRDSLRLIDRFLAQHATAAGPLDLALREVRSRLGYLIDVGLGYLTLDRPTRSLSGGETERVNLTTCLGTRLVNTLYVLDEPSVGLHPRDTAQLVRVLAQLRDLGNTVVVVEHEASVMRAADEVVDLGPGHGEAGGHLVFQGPLRELLKARASLTGRYLSGRQQIEIPARRRISPTHPPVDPASNSPPGLPAFTDCPGLRVTSATVHNLQNLTVAIPLGRLVCVTGVSGSGKTTLVRDVLLPSLEARMRSRPKPDHADTGDDTETTNGDNPPVDNRIVTSTIDGADQLDQVVLVDQSPVGRTPRSNPAVYIGAFDHLREWFAQSEPARQRGLNASAFSFNSGQGQCERCRGAGFEKIEMQFLSDVFIRCPDCNGRRYRPHILEVRIRAPKSPASPAGPGRRTQATRKRASPSERLWSIADILDATVDEVVNLLEAFADSSAARQARSALVLLQEVGLGYLRLGQPINTLSGGESQRLKLVSHLASLPRTENAAATRETRKPTLFLFDEPTTGLHFDDVRILIQVFQRLVDAGNSVLVIEHNLDLIKCADWIVDLGPEAGDEGGQLVACGTPEQIAACDASHTGRFLQPLLTGRRRPSKPERRS